MSSAIKFNLRRPVQLSLTNGYAVCGGNTGFAKEGIFGAFVLNREGQLCWHARFPVQGMEMNYVTPNEAVVDDIEIQTGNGDCLL